MLSDEMRDFLVSGPQGQRKAQAMLANDGAAHVRVQWRRYRDELMGSTPPGKRPWAFWMIERGLSHQPQGERGELRLIRQFDLYRDDAEKEFVRKRLAVITAKLRSHFHRRVKAEGAAQLPLLEVKRTWRGVVTISAIHPDVWTGRASQEAFGDGEVGLALMYPAFVWKGAPLLCQRNR